MSKRRTDRLRYTGEISFQELMRLCDKEAEAKEQRMTLQQLITKKYHPVEIGGVVICNAHPSEGRKMRVTERHMRRDGGYLYWYAKGKCINLDGSESKRSGAWTRRVLENEIS